MIFCSISKRVSGKLVQSINVAPGGKKEHDIFKKIVSVAAFGALFDSQEYNIMFVKMGFAP